MTKQTYILERRHLQLRRFLQITEAIVERLKLRRRKVDILEKIHRFKAENVRQSHFYSL